VLDLVVWRRVREYIDGSSGVDRVPVALSSRDSSRSGVRS
jgi:hypothetical protein